MHITRTTMQKRGQIGQIYSIKCVKAAVLYNLMMKKMNIDGLFYNLISFVLLFI